MSDTLGDAAPAASRRVLRSSFSRFTEWVAVLLLLVTVAGLLADYWWFLDLTNHVRPHLLVLLVGLCLAPSVFRRRLWLVMVLGGAAVNAAMVVPILLGRDTRSVDAHVPPLTVLAFNVYTPNPQHEHAIAYVAAIGVDLVLLQETSDHWLSDIRTGLKDYEVLAARPRVDNFGITLLARRDPPGGPPALRGTSVRFVDPSGGSARVTAIELIGYWHDRPLAFLGLHTLPPVQGRVAANRDAQLRGAAQWARRHEDVAVIIAGDLNATPWSIPFRRLISESGLRNSMNGHWPTGTWHASLPGALQIPIDHCLYSDVLVLLSRQVGADSFGSDHRPVKARFGWLKATTTRE